MGTVRGVCAILPDWHSATFRLNTKERLKALTTKKSKKGGFKISINKRVVLRNTKNGHFDLKKVKKSEQHKIE